MAYNKNLLDKYLSDAGLAKIKKWSSNGLTRKQIATNMGITERTLFNWCKKFKEIDKAVNEGQEVVEKELVNALMKKALGYKDSEVKVERFKINGEVVENVKYPTKEIITTKTFPPDVAACAFLLKCRFGWKEKSVIELDGKVENNNPLAGLTTEELKKLIDVLDKKND